MVDLTKLTPNGKRGYILAREFLFSQFFLWAGVIMTILHYAITEDYHRDFQESTQLGLSVTLLYFPFLYIRVLIKSWRVWRGYEQPEEITLEQEKAQIEAAQATLKQMSDQGS